VSRGEVKMNKKIGIAVCSASCIDYISYPKDIKVLRLVISFGDDEYEDYNELTADAFYEKLNKSKVLPKTAFPSIGKITKLIDYYKENKYEELIIITLSSGLSGLFNSCQMVANETTGIKITVFDSKSAVYAESYMALVAHKMASEGSDTKDIISALEEIRKNNKVFFAVESLELLIKNGRLSKLSGTLANILRIKPLLSINESGKIESIEKIRTFPKAVARIIETYFKETKNKDVITYVLNGNNKETADEILSKIKAEYPNREVINTPISPVIGAHVGSGAVAIGYIIK
ncbi:DegV family protein, partial [Acholeplasma sp. OttesenSCG-928-E16]|nr:DegV family protein [Acholeplasma sp. OttesenSCG-928-E16]